MGNNKKIDGSFVTAGFQENFETALASILATMPWQERRKVDRIADTLKGIVESNGNAGIIALSLVFQNQTKKE